MRPRKKAPMESAFHRGFSVGCLKNLRIPETMRPSKAQDKAVSRDGHRPILRREPRPG